MNHRIRIFGLLASSVLVFGLMVFVGRLGRANHPGPLLAAAPPPPGSADVDECTGTAGFWVWSTETVSGMPVHRLECRRYA